MRLLAFGDSITYGSWDTEGGWVERLKKRAHTVTVMSAGTTKMQIINLGIGGNTSTALRARIESEIESRLSPGWPLAVSILIGTNDGRSIDGRPEVTIEQYEENIETLITLVQKYTDKLVLIGLPPLGTDTLNFKGQVYTDATIKRYDEVLRQVATRRGVTYVATRQLFEDAAPQDVFCYDLLHPSDKGHQIIARCIGQYIQELKISS